MSFAPPPQPSRTSQAWGPGDLELELKTLNSSSPLGGGGNETSSDFIDLIKGNNMLSVPGEKETLSKRQPPPSPPFTKVLTLLTSNRRKAICVQ